MSHRSEARYIRGPLAPRGGAHVCGDGLDQRNSVFVCLDPEGEPPTIFVATPSEVRARAKELANRRIVG